MDAIKAEIARKKKQIEESEVLAPQKKYFKRGDLAAKQEMEYWKKHKRLKLVEEMEAEDSNDSETELSKESSSGETKEHKMPPHREVVRRLRDRTEPIRLFGESDYDTYKRLKHLEMTQPELEKGFKNDFMTAMDQVDQQYLQDILQNKDGSSEGMMDGDVKVVDDGLTMNEIIKMAVNLRKGDEAIDNEVVLRYFKLILTKWGNGLNERDPEQKRSFAGKMGSATHSQTVAYIKPLFRKLKKREMDSDILDCLAEIVKYLLARHYLKANDSYLEMAIGNAPWPIGVTMVGIHARTGREKIFSRNVAHVLNDETQRKYIQAVKRLMTQAQKYFPTDPSFSVNFDVHTQR